MKILLVSVAGVCIIISFSIFVSMIGRYDEDLFRSAALYAGTGLVLLVAAGLF